jgi:hypothetical protein
MEEKNNLSGEVTLTAIAELLRATTESLEAKIAASTKETVNLLEQKIDNSVGDLAAITQKHFLKIEGGVSELTSDIQEIKLGTIDIKADLNKKVDIFAHNDLIYRVEKLEKKLA